MYEAYYMRCVNVTTFVHTDVLQHAESEGVSSIIPSTALQSSGELLIKNWQHKTSSEQELSLPSEGHNFRCKTPRQDLNP